MHFSEPTAVPPDNGQPWWKLLTRYHWFVLIVAALGWMFDCLDQQLFTLSRQPAIKAVLGLPKELSPDEKNLVTEYSGYATSIFLIGWATGGLAFGVMGDRIGRAKTMLITILMYSLCTGLSALSQNFWQFASFRFLTGLGVGGEFAVGIALVAEVMPDRARPFALGLLQALSAFGNIAAALIGMLMSQLERAEVIVQGNSWRWMFVIGALPALLAVVVRRGLKEPERWMAQSAAERAKLGRYSELFGDSRWRRNTIVGLMLAFAGVVGLWGIGFFSPELTRMVLRKEFEADGLAGTALSSKVDLWASLSLLLLNFGAFFGIYMFSYVSHRMGRRLAFAICFVIALISTASVFLSLEKSSQIFWMIPIMGFCQLSLFGGYAIYFPELFPTRLRSTGTSFCYNVGRFVAAVGPSALGLLTSKVFKGFPEPMRYAGVTMCAVFLIGLLALPFAPETRGKPLPE